MGKVVRVLSWNVNGIRAAHKKGFLNWLESEFPDVLCLQESKATVDQVPADLIKPPGYTSHWNSALKKGYSGVGIYTKQEPLTVETGMGIQRFDEEGRFIRMDFPDFTLLNIYFPNGKMGPERLKFKLDFYDDFLSYIESLRRDRRNLVFVGDLNTAHREIDLARPKENEKVSGFLPIEREWIDKVIDRGYVDTFRSLHPETVEYSWWDLKSKARERNVGWRIDCVFVTPEMLPSVKKAFILTDVTGSDHCPVGIELAME
jgi:exodeoxyribonuclease III